LSKRCQKVVKSYKHLKKSCQNLFKKLSKMVKILSYFEFFKHLSKFCYIGKGSGEEEEEKSEEEDWWLLDQMQLCCTW
jgi:hypothetical protein